MKVEKNGIMNSLVLAHLFWLHMRLIQQVISNELLTKQATGKRKLILYTKKGIETK
jgi:hypothetical protein